ncbi:hypothetical protein OH77DRAFT_188768 [Trametes cingulata]|nr:hypothetical protein OH77DRAFT_188768 [Trametes cingulata]
MRNIPACMVRYPLPLARGVPVLHPLGDTPAETHMATRERGSPRPLLGSQNLHPIFSIQHRCCCCARTRNPSRHASKSSKFGRRHRNLVSQPHWRRGVHGSCRRERQLLGLLYRPFGFRSSVRSAVRDLAIGSWELLSPEAWRESLRDALFAISSSGRLYQAGVGGWIDGRADGGTPNSAR